MGTPERKNTEEPGSS
jgi:hypothetical protein